MFVKEKGTLNVGNENSMSDNDIKSYGETAHLSLIKSEQSRKQKEGG